MKRKILNAISTIAMALVMFALPVFSTLDSAIKGRDYEEVTAQTRTVSANNSMDFDNYYNKIQEQCKDVKFEYDEEYNQFNLTATQEIPISALENEEIVLDMEMENISLTYQTIYDPETNLVTLFVYSNGEVSDALVGCPFTKENGEVDVVFSVDDELIYLSELQDAGVIQNCGWFSRALKKIAKVAAVVAVTVAVVAVTAVVIQVAAPVIVTAVSTVISGVSGGAAVLGSTAAAAASIASGAAAIASTGLAVAATAAVVAGTAYVASEIVESMEETDTKKDSSSSENKKSPKGDNKASDGDNVPDYPGDNPSECSGEGYEWRGNGDPSSGEGNWYNPETGETLHPDLGHEEPYGPHWDYKSPNSGKCYRIFPDGSFGLK